MYLDFFIFIFYNLKYNQSYYGNKFVWPKVDKVGHIETLMTDISVGSLADL